VRKDNVDYECHVSTDENKKAILLAINEDPLYKYTNYISIQELNRRFEKLDTTRFN